MVPQADLLLTFSEGLRARCLVAIGASDEALAIATPLLAGRFLFRSESRKAQLEALEALADWTAAAEAADADAATGEAAGDVELSVIAARIGALADAVYEDLGAAPHADRMLRRLA
jgi:hypothetical protein